MIQGRNVIRKIRSRERIVQGTNGPRNECSQERMFRGMNGRENESSIMGMNVPVNEYTWERMNWSACIWRKLGTILTAVV